MCLAIAFGSVALLMPVIVGFFSVFEKASFNKVAEVVVFGFFACLVENELCLGLTGWSDCWVLQRKELVGDFG